MSTTITVTDEYVAVVVLIPKSDKGEVKISFPGAEDEENISETFAYVNDAIIALSDCQADSIGSLLADLDGDEEEGEEEDKKSEPS